jgi:predicted PurR-regulated permease PerM
VSVSPSSPPSSATVEVPVEQSQAITVITAILDNPWLARLVAVLLTMGNLVLLLWLLNTFQPVFNLVAMGLMLVYILLVPVNLLEQALKWLFPFLPKGHRFLAITGVYLLLLYGLESVVIRGYPVLKEQITELVLSLPAQLHSASLRITELVNWFPFLKEPCTPLLTKLQAWSNSSEAFMTQAVQLLRSQMQVISTWVLAKVGPVLQSSVGQLMAVVTLLVFVFYCLMEGQALVVKTVARFPVARQPLLGSLVNQLHCINMAFIKGQVLLGALTGVYMFIVYSVFGVKYALLLSLWFAVAELLPVVGTAIGLVPGLLLIILQGDFVLLAEVYGCSYVFQTIKDNILQPQVVGNALGLHPILIIISLLLGAKVAGLVGVVIALPVGALVVFVLKTTLAEQWAVLPTVLEEHAKPLLRLKPEQLTTQMRRDGLAQLCEKKEEEGDLS